MQTIENTSTLCDQEGNPLPGQGFFIYATDRASAVPTALVCRGYQDTRKDAEGWAILLMSAGTDGASETAVVVQGYQGHRL